MCCMTSEKRQATAAGFLSLRSFCFHLPKRLLGLQVLQAEGTIYMVLEYGDIDLARLLAKHEQARKEGGGGVEIDENFIRLYWQQMLQVGVDCCGMTFSCGAVSVTAEASGAPDSLTKQTRQLVALCLAGGY